jgi:hypothetical protein
VDYSHDVDAALPHLSDARVLDVGARDTELVEVLARRGADRYLGLVDPQHLARVRTDAGDRAHRFHALEDRAVVTRASADLLVIRRDHARVIWGWSEFASFRWVAIEEPRGAARWEVEAAIRIAVLRGRLRPQGRWDAGAAGSFRLFELTIERSVGARTYFSPAWGVEGLAEQLRVAGLDYAVLRWFEALPRIEPGEDLDILVRDEHVEAFRQLVQSEPGTQPIDLYSVSGLAGSDFRGAAYYIPELARRLLSNAVIHTSGMRVPAPDDHLHSLAYHALYHKGQGSGLASSLVPTHTTPEHDYAAALRDAAAACGRTFPATMEEIDDSLAVAGWRPPMDALRRLSVQNPWLSRRLQVHASGSGEPELAVFLLRERGVEALPAGEISSVLERWGFEQLLSRELDDEQRDLASRTLRGGNWSRGPYPVSGGPPARLIVCVHYAPSPVGEHLRGRYPHLSNEDVYYVKQAIRDLVESRVGPGAAFNAIHSADDEHESLHYLEALAPDVLGRLLDERERRVGEQRAREDVERTLSRGRRARVDVVATDRGRLVRKTYTASGSRHLARELTALDDLAAHVQAVPPVLDRGDNWFVLPLYQDTLPTAGLLPLPVLRQMVRVLRQIRAHGFVLVDAKPDNFVLDPSSGLKIVDLEFAYPSRDAVPLDLGPEFHEPDPALYRDIPAGDSSYETRWLPRVGMPLRVLLDGSPAAQVAHRAVHRVRALTVRPGSPLRARAARLKDTARDAKRRLSGALLRRAWTTDQPTVQRPGAPT